MKYSLYINTNGVEEKVNHDFNSLMALDYTTTRMRNKDDLLSKILPEDRINMNIYIKDSKDKSYAVVYKNSFLRKYIEEKSRNNLSNETLGELHNFLIKIKNFSVSQSKGYLIDPYNQSDLNKYEIRSLALPKVVRKAIVKYSKRREELINHPYSDALKKEFTHDKVDYNFNYIFTSNYENLRSLIVWANNYKKIVDKRHENRNTEDKQIMIPEVERLLKESRGRII